MLILFKKKVYASIRKDNKGLHKAKHDTTTACRQAKIEQAYIRSKRGHIILLDIVNYWTQMICLTH